MAKRKKTKKNRTLIWSILILLLAGAIATGIYFRVDEALVALMTDGSGSSQVLAKKKTEDKSGSDGDKKTKTKDGKKKTEAKDDKTKTKKDKTKTEEKDTVVVLTGDIELSSYVQKNYDAGGIEQVVSAGLRQYLMDADILEVNNEFAFSTRGTQAPDKQYTFRVNPSYVSVLTDLGVDVAGLANNHSLDYGKEALTDTFTTLSDAGIAYTGAGNDLADASKLVIKEANGKKIGFLAASRVIPVGSWNVENSRPGIFTCYDTTALINAIKEARPKVDVLFVCVHWGTEHTDVLTDYQKANGRAYIDAGADAVIGAHPHVLQGIEYYNGKPIFYSLGNFIFNQNINSTMAVQFTISPKNEIKIRLHPANAVNATTSYATPEKADAIFSYLMSISPGVSIDKEGNMTPK